MKRPRDRCKLLGMVTLTLLTAVPLAAQEPAQQQGHATEAIGTTVTDASAAQEQPAPSMTAADDPSARCLAAVVNADHGEGAWCDVLINDLNRALSRSAAEDARLLVGYHNRAVLAMTRADLEAAAADLAAALAIDPDQHGLYLTRGNLHLAAGRFADALTDFDAAIKLSNGSQPGYFRNRALALRALGEVAAAAVDALQADHSAPIDNPTDEGLPRTAPPSR